MAIMPKMPIVSQCTHFSAFHALAGLCLQVRSMDAPAMRLYQKSLDELA